MAIPTRAQCEAIVYGLTQEYPGQIRASTLRLFSKSALVAKVEGEVEFVNGLILRVQEYLDFKNARILDYSYTIYRGEEKIRWYDPQPHPENPALASTFPHHRHEPPAIKDNRRPAPGISFAAPNLPTLIADCEELGKTISTG